MNRSKGNREKFEAVRKHYPESLTITSKELDAVASAEGLATIWFTKDNFGTGKRGEYYIPDLVDGEFVMPAIKTDSNKNNEEE